MSLEIHGLDLRLAKKMLFTGVNLRIDKPNLVVYVLDEAGDPIEGADVNILSSGHDLDSVTDALGTALTRFMPAINNTLTVSKDGYATSTQIIYNETPSTLSVYVQLFASEIRLKVVNKQNQPIEGATCRVLNAELGLGSTKDVKATDGVDDYINFGDVLDLGLDSWTYELWFKKTKSGTNQGIIGKYNVNAANGSWSLVEETQLKLFLKPGGANRIISIATPLALNTWVHLACVFNRGGNMILYVNGIQAGALSIADLSATDFNNTYDLCLGRLATTYGGYWAGGRYSDLRVWKGVRTQQEIADNRTKRLAGNEAELEAYWPLMESGSPVKDMVGTLDGTVFGATSINDADLPIPEEAGAITGYDPTPYDSQTTNANGIATLNYQINTIHGLEVTLPGKRRFIMPFQRTTRGLLDWQVMLSDYLATFATDRGNILINSEPENNDSNFLIE